MPKTLWLIMSLALVCICPTGCVHAEQNVHIAIETTDKTARQQEESFVESPEVLKEIKRLEIMYPETSVGLPKYGRNGHQYTTYIVAREAGFNSERAYKLSYFSQLPDDEKEFSATLAFFYLFNLDYRKQIMAVLHSLHGGNNEAVLKRRSVLRDIIYDGIKNKSLKDYQIGLIIHAFADSYSHTTNINGQLKAFDYTWGHLFHGSTPDIIVYDPVKYKDYVCELYKTLSLEQQCLPKLKDLYSMIKGLESSRNTELPKFETYAKERWAYNQNDYNQKSKEWNNTVSKADIKDTFRIIEANISKK